MKLRDSSLGWNDAGMEAERTENYGTQSRPRWTSSFRLGWAPKLIV